MENGNNNNKNKIIIASLAAALIAVVSVSLYLKNRNGGAPSSEQSLSSKTLDGSDSSKGNSGQGVNKQASGSNPSGSSISGGAQAPAVEEPACKIVKMKPMDGKGTYRKNLLIIDSIVNAKSICVKVDGTPVKFDLFQKKSNQILIGGVRGSKAEIVVRFCREKNLCKEDCKIPRDEFMDALGASDDKVDSAARWDDGKESDNEKQVAKQMSAFKDDIKAIEAKAMAQMSKWDAKESAAACVGTGSVAQK